MKGVRVTRRSKRSFVPVAGAAAALLAAVGLLVPLAALGAGSSASGANSANARGSTLVRAANTSKALAYSHCMRSHGITKFPDPTSSGTIPKTSLQELGVGSTQFDAAQRACQSLLPPGTNDQYPPGEVQQLLIGMLRFSQCMRSHGIPKWPDPTTDSEGRPLFLLSAAGISRAQSRSAQVTHAAQACRHLMPPALPGIPIG